MNVQEKAIIVGAFDANEEKVCQYDYILFLMLSFVLIIVGLMLLLSSVDFIQKLKLN